LSTKKERCSKDWPWGLFVDWLSRASEKEVEEVRRYVQRLERKELKPLDPASRPISSRACGLDLFNTHDKKHFQSNIFIFFSIVPKDAQRDY
jgi:hypothetical protein